MNNKLSLLSVLDRKTLLSIIISFVALCVLISVFFIHADAFEAFYEFSRQHEDWELDEVLLALLAVLISFSVMSFAVVHILSKRLMNLIQQQLETETKQLQNRKLQSMGSMVGGVAHAMNNHLQPILILTRLIKKELPADSTVIEDLDRIYSAATSAAQTLRKTLNFAHDSGGSEESCKISLAVVTSIELAQTIIPSSIEVIREIDLVEGEVNIAKVDMEIIILNLANNAVDAFEGRAGQIVVSLYLCTETDVQRLNLDARLAWVCFSLTDTGTGMNSEQVNRIFEPFFTTKDVDKGSGLGLSENFGIVRKAGGTMDVKTELGHGTTVFVYLPIKKVN